MICSGMDSFVESMNPEFSIAYSQRSRWTSNVQWKMLTETQLTCKICKMSQCRPMPCMLLANHKAWKSPALMQTVTGVVLPAQLQRGRMLRLWKERSHLQGLQEQVQRKEKPKQPGRQLLQIQCPMKLKEMCIPRLSLPIAGMTLIHHC